MTQAPPAVRDVARRLLEQEAGEPPGPEAWAEAAANACRKLHGRLAPVIGSIGFDTLLARALALACKEYPCLEGIEVRPGGVLAGYQQRPQDPAPGETDAGMVVLLANIFWLLVTFVGEDLAVRLVGEVWPAASDVAAGLEESER